MKRTVITFFAALLCMMPLCAETVIDLADYGVRPDRKENSSPRLRRAIEKIKAAHRSGPVTLRFAPGRYDFHETGSFTREYYISNHDQPNPKHLGLVIEDWDSVTVEGSGADFIFHGTMLPVAVTGSEGVTLRNFHIDFENPHIAQARVLANGPDGIEFETAPWVRPSVDKKTGSFYTTGEGWRLCQRAGIAFDGRSRHLVYRTSDIGVPLDSVVVTGKNRFRAPRWTDSRLAPGTVVAMRTWDRPTPGIFLADNVATTLTDVKVHYAQGMGLLAQMCDGITLEGFGVCLRGDDDPRYFTTQADATHFSGCKGHISSTGGLYEGMMDDAINVHGTYLKVVGRSGSRTLRARYMHGQSYGFRWGEPGDTVQPVNAPVMERFGSPLVIQSISPADKPAVSGAKEFDITFTTDIPDELNPAAGEFGLENLAWCPSVTFADNIIRNNRARGSLFSTPRRVVVERNLFDHTSGTAILLCGDCMGWYETGACRDVAIRQNRFVNALTNMFQFTEAVISIYPEISDLGGQTQYFHGGPGTAGIVIEDNDFETFDNPLLYAKSAYGLVFRKNRVTRNTDYPAFHPNRFAIKLERAAAVEIYGNTAPEPLSTLVL